jgi:hypothetical protein
MSPLVGGCTKGDGGSAASADATASDLLINMSVSDAMAGQDITFVVETRKGTIKNASWAFYRKEEEALSLAEINPCLSGTNGQEVTCNFPDSGSVIIEVQAEMFAGDYKMVRREISVLEMDGIRNQSPIIVLDLGTTAASKATMATFAEEEKGEAVFVNGSEVTFDFRRTRDDENSADELSYKIQLGEGGGFQDVGPLSTHKFDEVGFTTVTVRVTDSQGNYTDKKFTLYTTCDPSTVPTLVLDPDAVSITNKAAFGYNFFGFAANGVHKSGGQGPYKYRWDFNGDGTWDTQWSDDPTFDYSDPLTVYVNHMHNRGVRVKVWDTKCQYVDTAIKEFNFPVDFSDGVKGTPQGPQIPNYYFVQGKVSSVDNPDSQSTKVDFWSGDLFTASYLPRRVMCKYDRVKQGQRENEVLLPKATFYIKGLEQYNEEDISGKNPPFKIGGAQHGFEIKIQDIFDDTFSEGGPQTLSAEGRSIVSPAFGKHSVNFHTDRDGDGVMDRHFVNKTPCDIGLLLQIFGPGIPCARDDEKGLKYTVQVDGTFTCPDMRDGTDEQLKIEQGAFFCEVNIVDACHGGCCCCSCSCEAPVPQ